MMSRFHVGHKGSNTSSLSSAENADLWPCQKDLCPEGSWTPVLSELGNTDWNDAVKGAERFRLDPTVAAFLFDVPLLHTPERGLNLRRVSVHPVNVPVDDVSVSSEVAAF